MSEDKNERRESDVTEETPEQEAGAGENAASAESESAAEERAPEGGGEKASESEGDQAPEDAEALRQELESAREEAEKHRNEHLRTVAELENVRKRSQREIENARKFGVERLAEELLNVKDSLEMGIQAAREKQSDAKTLLEGKEVTLKQLAGVLDRFGITEIDPAGEPFDPEYHEAMTMQPSDQQAPDTVLTVIQKGYLLNGRLLRPARVVVAKAPEEPAGNGQKEDQNPTGSG